MCETKKATNVKIIDFGLATKLNPDEVVKVTTATAEFAAPEIVEREPVGFYTDMWAIGVLAYVLWVPSSPWCHCWTGLRLSDLSTFDVKGSWPSVWDAVTFFPHFRSLWVVGSVPEHLN